ncbi:hypothetical protein GCM10012284_54410 [Mangrovihabitans endophyticus]|uniref:DNA-binding transcriptional activator of the SARP family n=2 Tax=Mangrovihabitans endophyticus TaxID=1751298 RepID=A0A8J3FQW0_9ACTN|nr:hypothetical protein GCM10012284_54410 [Mangrovihabitans endophyticus]
MRWIRRAGTALAAAVMVVLVVAGPPVAALWWVRAHRWRLPSPAQVSAAVQQPPGAAAVAALISMAAIGVWLLLVAVVVLQARAAVRAAMRRLRAPALPSAAQVTAGSMAGVAALALPGVTVAPGEGIVLVPAAAGADLPGPHADAARAGIDLPGGGWVPYRTALAVSVLGAMIWLHRRQHYQPHHPRGGGPRDADLQPLPDTADALIAVAGPPAADHLPGALVPDLPGGLLVLHGPGAPGAARGLLVTALLGAALGRAAPAVTARPADLDVLLGPGGELPAGLPGLRPGAPAAGAGTPACCERPARHPTLVIHQPTGADTTVLLGHDGPHGRRWQVDTHGRVTSHHRDAPLRLCLLDAAAAADLLRLVEQHTTTTMPSRPAGQQRPAGRGQLQLLGGCRLQVDGVVVHPRRSAALQILAYLAVHPAGASTTDLIRAVWPGLDPNTITKRLHTTLSDLRRQLQPALSDPILRHDERYRLNRDQITTDLDHLRDVLAAAAGAVTSRHRRAAARTLTDAYPGELAAGFSWPWLPPPREALRRDVLDAFTGLAAAAPPDEALDHVRAALAADPHNQALHAHARDLLTALGDPHTANR